MRFALSLLLAVVASAQTAEQAKQIFTTIRHLEAAEANRPADAKLESELALNFLLADQHHLFEDAIAKALSIDPRLGQAYYLRGRFALETQQDPRSAIQYFRKALELAPDASQAGYYLAIALRDVGQPGQSSSA